MRKRRLIIVFIVVIALVGAIGGWWISLPPPFEHPEVGVKIVHALSPGAGAGCSACHSSKMAVTNDASCKGCHDGIVAVLPGTTIGSVDFDHHKLTDAPKELDEWAGTGDGCINSVCHDMADDVRYLDKPASSGHSYCTTCHEMGHTD